MKYFIYILLTILLAIVLNLFLPWWSIMLAAFIASAIVRLKKASVFIAPFLAITVLWCGYAWIINANNDSILATKIANLLPLNGNTFLLILITGIVGGIAAGLAGICGSQFRRLITNDK